MMIGRLQAWLGKVTVESYTALHYILSNGYSVSVIDDGNFIPLEEVSTSVPQSMHLYFNTQVPMTLGVIVHFIVVALFYNQYDLIV